MKIIKPGNPEQHRAICGHCGCEFQFTRADTRCRYFNETTRAGFFSFLFTGRVLRTYVYCPVSRCRSLVFVDKSTTPTPRTP